MLSPATEQITFTRPWMYPKQHAAIFDPARYSLIEASTKSGKTVGCMVWAWERAMHGKPGDNVWWVAPIYSVAKIAYRRFKRYIDRSMYEYNNAELTLTLPNGVVMWFKGGDKPDSLYGEDVVGAVIDEASRLKEESWWAVRTTLTYTQGPARLIGNVKGKQNWFWRLCRRAEQGAPGMRYHRITWQDAVDARVLDLEEIEDARRQLPEAVFQELYEAVATDDGGNPFGIRAIGDCIRPLNTETIPVVWGWDLAKAEDWTVGIALNGDGNVCRFERWQHEPWDRTIQRIRAVTAAAPALVDSTGLGDPVLDIARTRGGDNLEGFKFTSGSKQQLMEALAVAIQSGEIGFPAGPIVDELLSFEYEPTRLGVRYSAPQGLHDDCVCALALAWTARSRYFVPITEIGSIVGESNPWDA